MTSIVFTNLQCCTSGFIWWDPLRKVVYLFIPLGTMESAIFLARSMVEGLRALRFITEHQAAIEVALALACGIPMAAILHPSLDLHGLPGVNMTISPP